MKNYFNYVIEAGIETKYSLTTRRGFYNAVELKSYIDTLDTSVWYVVENKSGQPIIKHNYGCEGTVYMDSIGISKVLLSL